MRLAGAEELEVLGVQLAAQRAFVWEQVLPLLALLVLLRLDDRLCELDHLLFGEGVEPGAVEVAQHLHLRDPRKLSMIERASSGRMPIVMSFLSVMKPMILALPITACTAAPG